MVGSQIFQQGDKAKYYPNGVVIMIAMVAFGLVMVGMQLEIYKRFNARLPEVKGEGEKLDVETGEEEMKGHGRRRVTLYTL